MSTLVVMQRQEISNSYSCGDYLSMVHRQRCILGQLNGSDDIDNNHQFSLASSCRGVSPTSTVTEGSSSSSEHMFTGMMCESWRESICLWAYDITDRCSIDRSIVEICMSYLDRYLDKFYSSCSAEAKVLTKETLQLCSVSCLYLATKLHEHLSSRRKLCMYMFVKAANGAFSIEDIKQMEMKILSVLGWYMNPPSRLDFTRLVVMDAVKQARQNQFTNVLLSPSEMDTFFDLTRFLIELSVCDYYFVTKRPSLVALSAVMLATQIIYDGNKCHHHLLFGQYISKYASENLRLETECHSSEEIERTFLRLRDLYKSSSEYIDNDLTVSANSTRQQELARCSPIAN